MKNFTYLSRTVLAGLLVALLTVTAQAQTHFGSVSGEITDPQWTLYLTDIDFNNNPPAPGDELGIFDGSTLVGVIEFDGTETFGNNTNNGVITSSTLSTGPGFTSDNEITFIYWDENSSTEYIGIFTANDLYVTIGGYEEYYQTGDATPIFPGASDPGWDEPISFIDLEFNTGGSIDGTVDLGANSCNGDYTSIRVEAIKDGSVQGYDYADESGNYVINGLPLPASSTETITYSVNPILIDHQSDGPTDVTLSQGVTSKTQDFTLTPLKGNVHLTLTEVGTAKPVIDATAELFDADGNSLGNLSDSDDNGVYAKNNVCVGDGYYIEVTHADYTDDNTETFSINSGGTTSVNLELEALPGSFTGVVKDDGFTNPVQGAYVKVFSQDTPPVELYSTTTNENGEYTISDVPVGTYDLEAGGTIGGTSYTKKTVTDIEINANTNTTQNFTIKVVKGSIEGVVRSSTNSELINNVLVRVFDNPDGASVLYQTYTNSDGQYSFTDEVEPGIYDVKFIKGGYVTRTKEYVVVNSNETTALNAYLEEQPGALDITVQDASSNAITGASVKIGSTYTATDNNNGTYSFTNLPIGTYDVTVTHDEYRTKTVTGINVTYNGGNANTKTITLAGYNWSITSANTLEDVWTIYLQTATLDGEPVDINDEIGIFDNNGSDLVGVYHVESELFSWNADNQPLKAYSEIGTSGGYTVGQEYTFKLYDASADKIVTSPTVTLSDPNSAGAHMEDVFPDEGYPFSYAALEFRAEETQVINLEAGYQMISTRLEMPDMSMPTIITEYLSGKHSNLEYVKNDLGEKYVDLNTNPGPWENGIGNWNVEKGYLVKMIGVDEFSFTGTPIDPQTEIELVNGFNLISYLPETSMDAVTAFASIKSDIIFVRNSDGDHYWNEPGHWVNGIGNLNPGEAYYILTSAATTFQYPSAKNMSATVENDTPEHFVFEGGDATYPVYTIYVESEKLEAGDEIAAFDGNKMVGATKIEAPTEITSNDLNLFSVLGSGEGYTPGNQITFKVWSPRTNEEYTNIDVEYLNPNGDAHTENTFPEGEGHYSMIKASVTELAVPEFEEAVVNVYPNPATNNMFIKTENDMTQIRVLNATGQVIMTKQVNAKEFTLNVNGMDAGIYILQTTFENRQSSLRFAVQ